MNEQFENVAMEEVTEVVTTTNTKPNSGIKAALGVAIIGGIVGGIVYLVKRSKRNRNAKTTDDATAEFDKLIDEVE